MSALRRLRRFAEREAPRRLVAVPPPFDAPNAAELIAGCNRDLAQVADEIDATHADAVRAGCTSPAVVVLVPYSAAARAFIASAARRDLGAGPEHMGSRALVFCGPRQEAHELIEQVDPGAVRALRHVLTLRAPDGYVPIFVVRDGATHSACWPLRQQTRGQA